CNCEAVIHMDPICVDDPVVNELKEQLSRIIITLDESLMFHDFRVVNGPTHTNLIFDVLVPYRFHMTDAEVISAIDTEVKKLNPTYFCVIKVDHTYI
ncbi:MAG: cation-efflux pump, partial [Lachnospiraceae bacterium]|nr:cation-efflux pump [Lachnospiraceae bacterium]